MDKTKHNEDCVFVKPREYDNTIPKPKTKNWFKLMGAKDNCPSCDVALEFGDDK